MTSGEHELQVLLIEDDDDHAAFIDKQLRHVKGLSIQLVRKDRLATGLEQLETDRFDSVLLDLNLPDSSGVEMCDEVCRAAGAVPVIALTSLTMASDAAHLVRARVEDYLPKSDLDGELLARVILCAVERAARRQAETGLQHARGELDAARQIQMELLPTTPPKLPGLEIAAACRPAEFVAGDYYDFLPAEDGTLNIALGDACGHGPRAAMLMAVAAGCVRSAFAAGGELGAIMSRVNSVLVQHPPKISLMTLLLTRVDPKRHTFVYTSAGHPHGFLVDQNGILRQRLEKYNGVSLGVVGGASYEQSEPIDLPPGHLLVIVSDGILESHPGNLDMFGERRLGDVLAQHHADSLDDILRGVHDAVASHLAGCAVEDDLTVVAMRCVD